MKLSWASTRDRVVCQLGESRNGKKSWWIFERESENELASEQAREREREIVFRIHRTYSTFAKCVPNYATSVPPPPLESIRFFILVKRHEPLLTRFQNFVGHSPPTCPAYFEPSFLRNCTLLPPLTGHEKSSQHPPDLLFLLPVSLMVVRAARTISAYLIDRRYRRSYRHRFVRNSVRLIFNLSWLLFLFKNVT